MKKFKVMDVEDDQPMGCCYVLCVSSTFLRLYGSHMKWLTWWTMCFYRGAEERLLFQVFFVYIVNKASAVKLNYINIYLLFFCSILSV